MPDQTISSDSSGFVLLSDVVPNIVQEIRYFSTYNFVGDRIDGYEEPIALWTREAAEAFKIVNAEFNKRGLYAKVYDCYRPTTAVDHFMRWDADYEDQRMKYAFYPDIDKSEVIKRVYIATRSTHSRGSAIDLTLLDMASGRELDMGGPFDLFDAISHPDYDGITPAQKANRELLTDVMVGHGWIPMDNEWWHFTLGDEPYPDTYFSFPVALSSIKRI